ncbi:uncharacterized protein EMH_0051840 [Eimeria mitis]|uniref:Uncharacterized protein n=1 Tax=Eimeria mitis TaxID=44415 RepID=U6K048_9EIME|nr:uncharacterized protein EMH_0051840 [Eimeria mitis]CDJ29692.1 hypothetical protein EMH_0051840 [Eimeria mitis]
MFSVLLKLREITFYCQHIQQKGKFCLLLRRRALSARERKCRCFAVKMGLQENACSKRKPAAQLTKDHVQGESTEKEQQETETPLDLKEADADTLKNRRRLKIVRTHAPPVAVCSEPLATKEGATESKAQLTPEPTPQAAESPAAAAAAPAAAAAAEPAATTAATTAAATAAADGAAAAPDAGQTAPAAPVAEGAGASTGTETASAADAAGGAAADAAAAAAPNGNAAAGNGSSSSSNGSGGGGLFGSVLKGTSAFVSPFGSLGAAGSSFLLPSAGASEGSSLFKGTGAAPAAEAEDADVPPPEEPTVVTTTVDSKEEVIFTDVRSFSIAGFVVSLFV